MKRSNLSSFAGAPEVSDEERARQLGSFLGLWYETLTGNRHASGRARKTIPGAVGVVDPDVSTAVRAELESLIGKEEARRLAQGKPEELVARIRERLLNGGAHSLETLWALLGGESQGARPIRATGGTWGWLAKQLVAGALNLIIALSLAVTWLVLWVLPGTPPQTDWPSLGLKVFALWALSFLPCWLYVRFLGQRAGALWQEYVLNLHRLAWDRPRFLPRPPRSSEFYDEWVADGGLLQPQDQSIYRQKFNAYYGRSVSDIGPDDDFRVRTEALFPIFLTAAVFATCWTAVLYDIEFVADPSSVWDVLKFAFLGAYTFIAQLLLRRFFASDLRPSAYTSALLRIVVVLFSVAALYQVLMIWLPEPNAIRWQAAIAFVAGFVPVVAMQVLVKAISALLRVAIHSFGSDYPLSQIDGLTIWYEARLAEENIEDMQNLVTANLIDVILHTRVPVGRLIDWVDQAYLFLHLDRVEQGVLSNARAHWGRPADQELPDSSQAAGNEKDHEDATAGTPPVELTGNSVGRNSRAGTKTRTILRQLGIRSATSLLTACCGPACRTESTHPGLRNVAGLHATQITTLVRVLHNEPGLAPVWNWRERGVPQRGRRLWQKAKHRGERPTDVH